MRLPYKKQIKKYKDYFFTNSCRSTKLKIKLNSKNFSSSDISGKERDKENLGETILIKLNSLTPKSIFFTL